MGRFLVFVLTVGALALPAAAQGVVYVGPFTPQVNNDGIEISVKRPRGIPRKVTKIEFHNLPVGSCFQTNLFFEDITIRRVNGVRRFHGSGHPGEAGNPDWPPTPYQTVTIHGRFKHRGKRIVGTFRLQDTHCGDTGALPYVANSLK
jgi:hypothetical protein